MYVCTCVSHNRESHWFLQGNWQLLPRLQTHHCHHSKSSIVRSPWHSFYCHLKGAPQHKWMVHHGPWTCEKYCDLLVSSGDCSLRMAHSLFHLRCFFFTQQNGQKHRERHRGKYIYTETHSKDKQEWPPHIHSPEEFRGIQWRLKQILNTRFTVMFNCLPAVLTRQHLLQTKLTSGGVQTRWLLICFFFLYYFLLDGGVEVSLEH